jgi:hypothetical protein
MELSSIIGIVRLSIPEAQDIDIGEQIIHLLDEINSVGLEAIKDITTAPLGDPELLLCASPMDRTEDNPGSAFNYWSDVRCLVLPSNLSLINEVYFGNNRLTPAGRSQYLAGEMPYQSYITTATNEMYLSFDLSSGDIIRILGNWTIDTIDILPSRYLKLMECYVLAGLYRERHRNPERYAYWNGEMQKAKRATLRSFTSEPPMGGKKGRLI